MKSTAKSKIFGELFFALLIVGVGIVLPSLSEAEVSIVLHNDTGYNLSDVKYVKEIGEAKSSVGGIQQLSDGGHCAFNLKEEGTYRFYASLNMGGKKVYAKGKASNLRNGCRYKITLRKVIAIQGGSGLRFIDQGEYDAIK